MSTLYFDTSALLKHYVEEPGSKWTRLLIETTRGLIVTSSLTIVEVACALARRRRESVLSSSAQEELWQAFNFDAAARFQTLSVLSDTLQVAGRLAYRHPLRAFDAVHLASALLTNRRLLARGEEALIFLSADIRLLGIAQAEGIAIDNPLDHEA